MFTIIERKTKTVIDEVSTIEEGENLILLIEKYAKEDGTFEKDAFMIVDENGKDMLNG